jgi:hypothetical protein
MMDDDGQNQGKQAREMDASAQLCTQLSLFSRQLIFFLSHMLPGGGERESKSPHTHPPCVGCGEPIHGLIEGKRSSCFDKAHTPCVNAEPK